MLSLLNAISTAGIVLLSVFGGLLLMFIVYLCFVPLKTYFTVAFSGLYISTFKLLALKNRKKDVKELANLYISAKKARMNVSLNDIDCAVESGADVKAIIEAMTLLERAGHPIPFNKALSIEMATKNIVEVAKNSLVSMSQKLEGVVGTTIDGYEISVDVNFSVKADLSKFSQALDLDALKNSLTASIIDRLSSVKNHEEVMATPNEMLFKDFDYKKVSEKSMYTLEDVNIGAISIIKDLNAEKEIKSAEKEKIYASIEAERIKNAEEIKLIQAKTKIENMKAGVLEAEAEVPRALSNAIKEGRFSVMDYYKLMNLQADTALRRAIIGDKDDEESEGNDEGDE